MYNILDYLEVTAKKYSEKIAVDDGNCVFTWDELLQLSQRIGTNLIDKVEFSKPIAIYMEKSSITLATMLGVVYSGCFYVMIDPSQPIARLQNICSVLEPQCIITDESGINNIKEAGYGERLVMVDDITKGDINSVALQQIRDKSKDTDILYGIFTSGSTGTPKGIVVSHRAVIDFIGHFVETFDFDSEVRIGNQAPFDFDVSVKDIYTSVMTGATLILIAKSLFSTPSMLLDFICEKKVTSLVWAVSALTLVSSLKGLKYKVPTDVKQIMFSGEVMPIKQLQQWQKALPDAKFVNLYGPSEITCNCTYFPIEKVYEKGEKVPIGKAFEGREVFLMDDNDEEIFDTDKSGEICVTGESISSGYYNNTEETVKRFVVFPKKGGRLCYRTGDLGYYDEDGQLYFSGRKDFQIKHMGHRIELEEIEQAIEQVTGIERCCCLMDYKRNKIVGYYFGEATTEDIRVYLKEKVPAFMIPQKLVKVDEIPLTKNGKMDRKYFQQRMEVNK